MSAAARRTVLFLALGLWNDAAWATHQWLTQPLAPEVAQPFQRRHRPGRHHLDNDPKPDPMDEVHADALRRIAENMAPHYDLRG